ncbi:response regulator transcription factor [Dielma fastidiosa]|uniref:response regulator transcription factor n=1 Tax=Dielma fastidiosa TaxID=1034346 RepID=UPI003562255F
MRLLIIEDNQELADLMKQKLSEFGYVCDVAYDGIEGDYKASDYDYDAVLLDLNLPDKDGFELLEDWRKRGFNVPVLIVSARDELDQRIKGLQLGSDDYITKPFEFAEINARIQAVIRRFRGRAAPVIIIEMLTLDPATRRVTLNKHEVALSAKEFDILEYLASCYPRIVSNEELAEHVYDENFDPFSGVIRVHMANIKKKLKIGDVSILRNEKGKGYYLCLK